MIKLKQIEEFINKEDFLFKVVQTFKEKEWDNEKTRIYKVEFNGEYSLPVEFKIIETLGFHGNYNIRIYKLFEDYTDGCDIEDHIIYEKYFKIMNKLLKELKTGEI